jgi:hypothetical protein
MRDRLGILLDTPNLVQYDYRRDSRDGSRLGHDSVQGEDRRSGSGDHSSIEPASLHSTDDGFTSGKIRRTISKSERGAESAQA